MDKNEITLQTYGKYSEQPKKNDTFIQNRIGNYGKSIYQASSGLYGALYQQRICFNKAYDETLAEESQKYGQVN